MEELLHVWPCFTEELDIHRIEINYETHWNLQFHDIMSHQHLFINLPSGQQHQKMHVYYEIQ